MVEVNVNIDIPFITKMWETLDKRFIATWMNPKRIEREGLAKLRVNRAERMQAIEFQQRELEASVGGELAVAGEPYVNFQRLAEIEQQKEYIRKQTNLGKSILHAEDAIKADDPVPEKEVDPDWLYRWKEQAEKFSADDMQLLWGKVLAGEFKNPGTFNYRALDVLSGLSKEDAESFLLLCSVSIWKDDIVFIYGDGDLNSKYGLSHLKRLNLRELGLLSYTNSEMKLSGDGGFYFKKPKKILYHYLKTQYPFEVTMLTGVGRALYSIVDVDFNLPYFRQLAQEMATKTKSKIVLGHNVEFSEEHNKVLWRKEDSEEFF